MMLDEMCYDSKARPIRERKMPEKLTHIETLARAQTGAALKTLAEIATDPSVPPRVRNRAAAAWIMRSSKIKELGLRTNALEKGTIRQSQRPAPR